MQPIDYFKSLQEVEIDYIDMPVRLRMRQVYSFLTKKQLGKKGDY